MKRFILGSGLLLFSTLLQADRYLLIMSQDDKLCQEVTHIFNDDLFKYKKVRFFLTFLFTFNR